MNKKILPVIIIAIIGVIIAMIVLDFSGNKPGKRGSNPYEYNVEEFKNVDPSLIHYTEKLNIELKNKEARGFDIFSDSVYITGENFIQGISLKGVQFMLESFRDTGTCIEVTPENIFIGFRDHIGKFDKNGKLIEKWESLDERTVITSICAKNQTLYAADAGNRRVIIYDTDGNFISDFKGKSEGAAGSGFIVPSPGFDLAVNSYGELWVANPGEHAIENYTDDGEMRGYWQNGSMEIEGFTGCCNPAHFTTMDDGSFVTSEKGIVRIKIYNEAGGLSSVVAPPSKFRNEGKAPEVAVDSKGNIYALDFDAKRIRVFVNNQS